MLKKSKAIPQAALDYAAGVRQLMNGVRPAYVIASPGRDLAARIAMDMAAHHGVPTIDVQTVAVTRSPLYKPPRADVATVLDRHHRDLYVRHFGLPERDVVMAGSPNLERMRYAAPDRDGTTMARTLGVEGRRIILFPTQPLAGGCLPALQVLLDVCTEFADVTTIVKTHPNETPAAARQYEQAIAGRDMRNRCLLLRDGDIAALLALSDIVVTLYSNVGMQAALLGKTVVVLNPEARTLPMRLDEIGAALGAHSREACLDVLRSLLSGGPALQQAQAQRARFAAENAHLFSGRATERIAELAEALATSRRSGADPSLRH